MTTFAALGCNDLFLAALEKRGYTTPTPVQAECFAPGLEGRDLLVQSRTGSGKTLAFGLPLLHRLSEERHTQAIILAPTRELAQQVGAELHTMMPKLPIASLVGGVSYPPQLKALSNGAPVVVGTPGRVMDHLQRGTLDLSKVSMVVLDECDEMLNMGFLEDVETILAKVPTGPQTFLFSATLPLPIAKLAKRFLKDPVQLRMASEGGSASHADIAHTPVQVPDHQRIKALVNLLLLDEPSAALIFTKTKAETEEVAEALTQAGLPAAHLHGDLVQASRTRILSQFKEGRLRYLVATDVAARGLDITDMPLVVHLGIPHQMENYVHRSGRTGRAGAKGTSMALVASKESRILLAWARRGGLKLDWRSVPTTAEISAAQDTRLLDRLKANVSPALLKQASALLETEDPRLLVAGLLGLAQGGRAKGFDIPEDTRREFQT
ncbi:MAG TPA: DEAD/DEAH box helicase, partial [Holophagaceae bacterium]|nr:DEAD/DEAH box helicase [Holophagaceae bacterium]